MNQNDQPEADSEEGKPRAVTAADIRKRVKKLQEKTGDLRETLERIDKRLEQAPD